jgi:hypothetical protein
METMDVIVTMHYVFNRIHEVGVTFDLFKVHNDAKQELQQITMQTIRLVSVWIL